MPMTRCRLWPAVALASTLALGGCGESPEESAAQAGAQLPKKTEAVKVEGLDPQMVAAVSASNGAPTVSVHFALGRAPVAMQAVPVEIALVPHEKLAAVRAHFEGQDGLTVTTGEAFGPASEPAVGKALKHQLTLLAAKEGMFMVTVGVETESNDTSVTRIFSIPVVVNSAGADKAATGSGQKPAKPAAG